MKSNSGIILMYHRVANVRIDPWGLCISSRNFANQLEVIKNHTTPLSLSDLMLAAANDTIPENACVLTFDDGYLDNLTQARPLLESFEIPATVYVTTAYIGWDRGFWWDELEKIFLHTEQLPRRFELQKGEFDLQFDLGAIAHYSEGELAADLETRPWQARTGSRLQLFFNIWKLIRKLPHAERIELIDQLLAWANLDPTPRASYRPMNSNELESISRDGLVNIGAHTVTHPSLPVCSAQLKRKEILDSKLLLERLLGQEIDHFAYPHGDYDVETMDMVRKAGFKSACITGHKICNQVTHNTNLFELPRFAASNISAEQFKQKINSWLKTRVVAG